MRLTVLPSPRVKTMKGHGAPTSWYFQAVIRNGEADRRQIARRISERRTQPVVERDKHPLMFGIGAAKLAILLGKQRPQEKFCHDREIARCRPNCWSSS